METRPRGWGWIGRVKPTTIDRLLVGFLVLLGLTTLLDPRFSDRGEPFLPGLPGGTAVVVGVGLALLLLQIVPLLWRRSHASLVLLLVGGAFGAKVLLGFNPGIAGLGLLIAMYSVAAYEVRARRLVFLVVAGLGFLAGFVVFGVTGNPRSLAITVPSGFFVAAWLIGDYPGQVGVVSVITAIFAVAFYAVAALASLGIALGDGATITWPAAIDILKALGATWLIFESWSLIDIAFPFVPMPDNARTVATVIAFILLAFGAVVYYQRQREQLPEEAWRAYKSELARTRQLRYGGIAFVFIGFLVLAVVLFILVQIPGGARDGTVVLVIVAGLCWLIVARLLWAHVIGPRLQGRIRRSP